MGGDATGSEVITRGGEDVGNTERSQKGGCGCEIAR